MFDGLVGFAIGTGRCGTNFISKVLDQENHISSVHERHPLNDTFHRYSKWYELPIDHEGFLQTKENEIKKDLERYRYSFEASPFLSLSTEELHNRFNAKFIFLVRSPERVVNSFLHKGWYTEKILRAESNLLPSYQGNKEFHHFLARFMPMNKEFDRWKSLTRVGKLSWYWNAMNEKIASDLSCLPSSCWYLVKLEDLDFEKYIKIARFLDIEVSINECQYNDLAHTRPNSRQDIPTIDRWDSKEVEEFEREVYPMAKEFDYEHRISFMKQTLSEKASQSSTLDSKKASILDGLKSSLGKTSSKFFR